MKYNIFFSAIKLIHVLRILFLGIPLEIGQPGWLGSLRVAALYFSGVLLGSVGASCIQPNMFLVGASAGVYALITAHLGIYQRIDIEYANIDF